MRVPRPDPEVAVQGNGHLAVGRQRPLWPALADHAGYVVLEVEVLYSKERARSGSLSSGGTVVRQSGGVEA